MVTGSMDTTITVHDLGENDHSHYTLQGHKAGVCSLTYSSEYQLLLSSGCARPCIRVCSVWVAWQRVPVGSLRSLGACPASELLLLLLLLLDMWCWR